MKKTLERRSSTLAWIRINRTTMKLLLVLAVVAALFVNANGFSLHTNVLSRPAVRSMRSTPPLPGKMAVAPRRDYKLAAAKEGSSSVVVAPDYKLAAIFLAGGALLDTIPYIQLFLGPIVTLLGILFAVQTTR